MRYRRMNSVFLILICCFGSPGHKPLAVNVVSSLVTDMILLFDMAILFAYLPRYSVEFPKPLNVSLIYGHHFIS